MNTPEYSNQALVEQLHRIADALENGQRKENKPMDEQSRKKAAYALNLCLVSVSQIIDYGDVYILEQEYQSILNNLNLEHMPKDDALLDILRQILDTITFFRIQEEEKKFIEQDYKRKMRTAVWKALPNCQVILGAGKWYAMLLMLVYQVGTGYMNYRNAKAEATQEHAKELWELQRAAIEQFNGLRRELFTTAWKLADRYNFDDAWRLTENQITQYNNVLMDGNLSRRLARLEDLEESFRAYPPFWYFKGHTALMLTQGEPEEAAAMKAVAKAAFEEYFAINRSGYELLRTDPIYASCALEYVSLLDRDEIDKKQEYIRCAIQHAGSNFDILQLCAMAYLDIGAVDLAAKILRHLVCEGYNEEMNAQLLSAIYVEGYLKSGKKDAQYRVKYNFLCKFAEEGELIPWPQATRITMQEQYADFIVNRREALMESYANFMVRYFLYKAREFRHIVANTTDCREKELICFARGLRDELSAFPYAQIGQSEFVRCIAAHKDELHKVISSGQCTNKTFETVFGDVFLAVAQSIAQLQLSTMEEITRLEIDLGVAVGSFAEKTVDNLDDGEGVPEDTLHAFLEMGEKLSNQFLQIKGAVKKRDLVRPGAKHMKLLISGEQEYYAYIKRNGLDENHVVAILNDQSVRDCDLVITETGLAVRDMHSGVATGAKVVLLGPVAFLEMGVRALLPREVLYADVMYTVDKLKKPNFKNKEVNMEELFRLIDEIKQSHVDDGIERKIYRTIVLSRPQIKQKKGTRPCNVVLHSLQTRQEKVDYCMAIVAVAVYYGMSIGDITEQKQYVVRATMLELLNCVDFTDKEKQEIRDMVTRKLHFFELKKYLEPLSIECLESCEDKMEEILSTETYLLYEEETEIQRFKEYIANRQK